MNNLLNWSAIDDSSSFAFTSKSVACLTVLNWITEAKPKVSGSAYEELKNLIAWELILYFPFILL